MFLRFIIKFFYSYSWSFFLILSSCLLNVIFEHPVLFRLWVVIKLLNDYSLKRFLFLVFIFPISLKTLSTSAEEIGNVKHAYTNLDKSLNALLQLLRSLLLETKKCLLHSLKISFKKERLQNFQFLHKFFLILQVL